MTITQVVRAAAAVVALTTLAACATPAGLSENDDRLQVVTTTALLRDLVQQVGGDAVNVTSIVPDGADPHSYEPTVRAVRDVVYADVAFSNYMLLEQHSIIKTLDANLGSDVPNISLAEDAVKYAAEIIPLVENVNLDTIWLGLRARGSGQDLGLDRTSDVLLSVTASTGPGDVFGYLTGSFGETEVYFDSSDGFDATNGYRDDTAVLPTDAHTHMSWVFTDPGIYTITVAARAQASQDARPVPLGEATFTFAVGVKPSTAGRPDATVLNAGHADLTVDLDGRAIVAVHDDEGGGAHAQTTYEPDDVVIEVPAKALAEIPSDPELRFLGRPGTDIYQLPQAVLGKHVHGEIDPHLWQDVGNVMSYVELIRDTLISLDPTNAALYRDRTNAYLLELEELDGYVRDRIAQIPADQRYLVTTHDAFGYLAAAYDIEIAGFVTPNPAAEPSLSDRRKLTETIDNLQVPAVFLEPNLRSRSSTLTEVAGERDVLVCDIYGDTFDDRVSDYLSMMRFNADSIHSCLSTPKDAS